MEHTGVTNNNNNNNDDNIAMVGNTDTHCTGNEIKTVDKTASKPEMQISFNLLEMIKLSTKPA